MQGYTPLEIKEANTARRQLTKASKAAGKKKTYRLIKDDRLVQRSRNSYSYFLKDRNDSGDLIGMTLVERARLIAQEWKKLSAAEKKVCPDCNTPSLKYETGTKGLTFSQTDIRGQGEGRHEPILGGVQVRIRRRPAKSQSQSLGIPNTS